MKIQEADAKSLLLAQGLSVPAWEVARNPDEVMAAAQRFFNSGAGRVVIKAQVLVGGRGKAGGVKLASTPDEAREVGSLILGMDIKGITVRKVLVGAAAEIVKEYYLGAIVDRASRRIVLMASAEGGVEHRPLRPGAQDQDDEHELGDRGNLDSRAGRLVWRDHLRDSHQERESRAGQEPLRHQPHLRRLL